MDPETGTFTSMDTWQGNLYEPVTLHKYLYANASPVKYKDPSGMFSLPECNVAMAVYTAQQNQSSIYMLSLMSADGEMRRSRLCAGEVRKSSPRHLEWDLSPGWGQDRGVRYCDDQNGVK